MTAADLEELGCDVCDGDELLALGGVAAVAPALPANDLDVWVGPRAHIASLAEVDRPTRSVWLAVLQLHRASQPVPHHQTAPPILLPRFHREASETLLRFGELARSKPTVLPIPFV